MAAGIVAQGGTDGLGHRGEVGDQFVDRFGREVGMVFERVVRVGDVSLMMFVVMDFHRARVDVRLEGVVCVSKRWKFVGHII